MYLNNTARKLLKIQTQHAKNLCRVREKSSGEEVKRRMKELKLMFGAMIETKREKIKRLKAEMKKETPVKSFQGSQRNFKIICLPSKDSELKMQQKSRVPNICFKITKYPQKQFSYKTINVKQSNTIEPMTMTNAKMNKRIKKLSNFVARKEAEKTGDILQEKCSSKGSGETALSKDPLIKKNNLDGNIIETPLFGDVKESSLFEESTEVMSLSSKDYKSYLKEPSVTAILNATMSEKAKELLDKWEKNMIAKLGIEGFQIYRQELLQNGKLLHSAIQSSLLHKPLDVHENIEGAFKSVNHILKDMSDVKAIESHVVHSQLHYRGYLDCVASYRGKLYVVDWKKSDKQKASIMSTYDAPLQVAAYIGALNVDKKYPFEVRHGMIVVAYTNGDKATVHEISADLLQVYWKSWLERLQKYRDLERRSG